MDEANSHQVNSVARHQDWMETQMQLAVKSIEPKRSIVDLERAFIYRFGASQRSKQRTRRIGAGTGLGVGAGIAADAYFGIEWLEMMESFFFWITKSMRLVVSLVII